MKKVIAFWATSIITGLMLFCNSPVLAADGNVYLNRSFDDTTVSEFDSPSDHTLGLSLEHSFNRFTPYGLIELNGTRDFDLCYTTYSLGTKVNVWKGFYVDGSYTVNADNLAGQNNTHVGVVEVGYEFSIFEKE